MRREEVSALALRRFIVGLSVNPVLAEPPIPEHAAHQEKRDPVEEFSGMPVFGWEDQSSDPSETKIKQDR